MPSSTIGILAYAEPELESLESAFEWVDRLAFNAMSAGKLTDHLDQTELGKKFRRELASQEPTDEFATTLPERTLAEHAAVPALAKRGSRRKKKRGPRAK